MLAPVPVSSVNQAVPLAGTGVHGVVLLTAAEETLDTNAKSVSKMHSGASGEDAFGEPGFTLGVWSSPCSLRR